MAKLCIIVKLLHSNQDKNQTKRYNVGFSVDPPKMFPSQSHPMPGKTLISGIRKIYFNNQYIINFDEKSNSLKKPFDK
jgi:hypothetical protein